MFELLPFGTVRALGLSVTTLFARVGPLSQALDYHLDRHNLLAANVAHVDTPNYKPVDLARTAATGDFGQVFQVALARTNDVHLTPGGVASEQGRVFTDLSAGGGADGNYVSLDREAAKLAANQLRYDIVSVLMKSELTGLMNAASDMQG